MSEMKNRKIKFGIIGFGIFGKKRLIPGFEGSQFGEIIAISKTNFHNAQQQAKEHHIPFAYDSPEKLLENEEIEAVFIATPNKFHYEHTILAAKAKKHILLEKPMAMNAQECEKMIEICEKNNVKFMIAHCMRFNSSVLYAKKMVDSGELGNIVSMKGQFYYDGTQSKRDWLWDADVAAGGPIADLGVHLIDTMRFISGKEVIAQKWINTYHGKGTVETKAEIILEFEDNITASVGVGFEGVYITNLEIIGTKCAISIPYFNQINREIEIEIFKNLKKENKFVQNHNCYTEEIDAFCKCIINDDKEPIPAKEGLINQKIIDVLIKNKNN